MEFWPPRYVVLGGIRGNFFRLRRADFWHMSFYMKSGEIFFRLRQADKKNLTSLGSYGFFSGIKRFGHMSFQVEFLLAPALKKWLKNLDEFSSSHAFFRNTNNLWHMLFLVEFDLPDMSFSMEFFILWSFPTEFSIPSMCRFRWNFGNYMYLMFKYFLFKTIFQRFTPGKQKVVSLLKNFGHKYFLPKYFLAPDAGQKMSFLVEFGGN